MDVLKDNNVNVISKVLFRLRDIIPTVVCFNHLL